MNRTKKTVLAGLFVALDIIFTRFFAFWITVMNRVSLQFLPNALCGYLLGPWYSVLACVAGDLLGMMINSAGQPYFPGFTLTAAVKGFLYGQLLYKKEPTFRRMLFAMAVVTGTTDLLLNPLWLSMMHGDAYFAVVLVRLPVKLAFIPVSAFILHQSALFLKKSKLSNL